LIPHLRCRPLALFADGEVPYRAPKETLQDCARLAIRSLRPLLRTVTLSSAKRFRPVDKQKKTATELEEIVKQRIGAGDFRVTVHRNPETGWHATIFGRQPAEVHRCQVMADTIAVELCQHYDLDDAGNGPGEPQ
jgi:hypothetical protein